MRCKTTVVRRVAVKASQNGDEIDGSGDADVNTARAVQRRAVLSALTAGAAWSATSGAARAAVDVGDYLSNLLVEKPPPPGNLASGARSETVAERGRVQRHDGGEQVQGAD